MSYFDPDQPPPDFTEIYASPDGHDQHAAVYLPDDANRNGAAVVCVHGGGWANGKRDQFLWHSHRLAQRGYVAISIDYRLTGVAPCPAAIEDCQAAVRWLRQNAARWKIDADRIGAIGSSAGGHLVACLGTFEDVQQGISSRVNCVVDVHGVHNFAAYLDADGPQPKFLVAFLGGPLAEKMDLANAASPALHVDQHTPPMLITHDPGDPTVPYEQSVILVNALTRAARPFEFLPTTGSGHGFVYSPKKPWTQQAWPVINAWLDRHLGVNQPAYA